MKNIVTALLLVFCLELLCIGPASAQLGTMFNQRDDQYRLLGLKRAKELYETSRKDYDRQKQLFEKGLISQSDLDRSYSTFADAEVNYQQSLLAVLFEQQYVTVSRAVKYQQKDGAKHVRLRVDNASGGGEEFQKLINIDDKLFRSLQPDIINDVYVSLLNNDGAVISQPYETKIEQLKHGSPRDIDFALLQDLDVVTVNIIYGKGTQRSLKVFLQKDASENTVAVQSQQFSQEVELGQSASYDLTLELFSGLENTFTLEVLNLPEQINRYFQDAGSQARLSQFRFTESANTRKASLNISLPDRPSDQVVMDKPIQFYVVVVPSEKIAAVHDVEKKRWTELEIEKLKVGYAKLELIPRGMGKIVVQAPQLFHSIKADGRVEMYVDVVNEGSRRLDNIELKADLPLNWTKNIDPVVIPTLGISEEKRVRLQFTPPADVAVGRYDIRLRTTALSDNKPIQADDKTVTVEIQAEANLLVTALIVMLILALVAGMVVFGIKLSRK